MTVGTAPRLASAREAARGGPVLALAAAAVGGVCLLIRLMLHGASFDLFGDEIIYADLGHSVINGGFPRFGGGLFFLHGPGFFYLEAGWERLLGTPAGLVARVYQMRTLNALLAAITAAVLVLLGTRAASLSAGVAAGLLFALDPFCIRQNDRVLLETAMMLWVLLGYLVLAPLVTSARPASPAREAEAGGTQAGATQAGATQAGATQAGGGRSRAAGRLRAAGAGLLFGCAILTKDEAAIITLLPLLAAAAADWGPRRPLIWLTVGAAMLPYAVYLLVTAANGLFGQLWAAKTAGVQRLLGLTQSTGFHSAGGGSLAARLIAEAPWFAPTYVVLILAVPALVLVLRRGGPLPRMLGLMYCASAVALGYALTVGTLEEQELYLLIVPTLLLIPVSVTLLRPPRAGRDAAGPARPHSSASRATAIAAVLALALVLGVNAVTAGQWLRSPDDGYVRLGGYLAAHVRPGTPVAAIEGDITTSQLLAGRNPVTTWAVPDPPARPEVRYAVVQWGPVDSGYSRLSPAQVRHLVAGGRLVFSFRGRTYGQLALYRLDKRLRPVPGIVPRGRAAASSHSRSGTDRIFGWLSRCRRPRPGGTYMTVLTGSVTGTTATRVLDVSQPPYNVSPVNADNYAAIQNAINAWAPGIIQLPSGTLGISNHLTLRSGIGLTSTGQTTLRAVNGFLSAQSPYGGYPVISTAGADNVTVSNLTLDQNAIQLNQAALPGRLAGYLLEARESTNVLFSNVTTVNPGTYSIAVVGSSAFAVTGCSTSVTSSGVYNQLDGIHVLDSQKGFVFNNTVDQRVNGATDGDDGIALHTIGAVVSDVIVAGNRVRGGANASGCIDFATGDYSISSVVIAGNECYGGPAGIVNSWYGTKGNDTGITIAANYIHDLVAGTDGGPIYAIYFTSNGRMAPSVTQYCNSVVNAGGIVIQ